MNKEYMDEDFIDLLENDFLLLISDGLVVPINSENNNCINIEITNDNSLININGKKYDISSDIIFNIKNYIESNIEYLIKYSKSETNDFISKNGLFGENISIIVKLGQLIISVNGGVSGEIGDYCKLFIKNIVSIIENKNEEYKNNDV